MQALRNCGGPACRTSRSCCDSHEYDNVDSASVRSNVKCSIVPPPPPPQRWTLHSPPLPIVMKETAYPATKSEVQTRLVHLVDAACPYPTQLLNQTLEPVLHQARASDDCRPLPTGQASPRRESARQHAANSATCGSPSTIGCRCLRHCCTGWRVLLGLPSHHTNKWHRKLAFLKTGR